MRNEHTYRQGRGHAAKSMKKRHLEPDAYCQYCGRNQQGYHIVKMSAKIILKGNDAQEEIHPKATTSPPHASHLPRRYAR